jgi:hypothetical protein
MSRARKLTRSRGTPYEITYRIHDRMVRRRFPTRAAALDAMAQARTQIRAGPISRQHSTSASNGSTAPDIGSTNKRAFVADACAAGAMYSWTGKRCLTGN